MRCVYPLCLSSRHWSRSSPNSGNSRRFVKLNVGPNRRARAYVTHCSGWLRTSRIFDQRWQGLRGRPRPGEDGELSLTIPRSRPRPSFLRPCRYVWPLIWDTHNKRAPICDAMATIFKTVFHACLNGLCIFLCCFLSFNKIVELERFFLGTFTLQLWCQELWTLGNIGCTFVFLGVRSSVE